MNLPIIPSRAFRSMAGNELAKEIARQESMDGVTGLILFSDPAGRRLALLPVGPGTRHENFEAASRLEIDGLAALCAMRLGPEAASAREAREKEFTQREEAIAARERYVAECEERLNEIARNLSEREVLLEHNEETADERAAENGAVKRDEFNY